MSRIGRHWYVGDADNEYLCSLDEVWVSAKDPQPGQKPILDLQRQRVRWRKDRWCRPSEQVRGQALP